MSTINTSDIAILNSKGSHYCCIISLISDLTKKQNITKHKSLLSHIRMCKGILTFGNIEIEKNKFYRNKTSIF